MILPVYQRYEIIFLSQHSMDPKLRYVAVAKAVECDVTAVKYWLKQWKQSKDLSDSIRFGRPRATTPTQDEQIVSLVEQQTFVTVRDIANKLRKAGATVNERTMIQWHLNEAGVTCNRALAKPLRLSKCIEKIV